MKYGLKWVKREWAFTFPLHTEHTAITKVNQVRELITCVSSFGSGRPSSSFSLFCGCLGSGAARAAALRCGASAWFLWMRRNHPAWYLKPVQYNAMVNTYKMACLYVSYVHPQFLHRTMQFGNKCNTATRD